MSCKSIKIACCFVLSFSFVLDKKLNDMVPQLIPREPVNINGNKPGFNSIRSNILNNNVIDIDPTKNAPIAVFDGKDNSTEKILCID